MNRSADRPAGSSPLRWAYFDGRQNRLRDVAWEAVSLLEAHGPSIVMRRSGRTQALEVSLGLRLVRLRRLALGHPVAEGETRVEGTDSPPSDWPYPVAFESTAQE